MRPVPTTETGVLESSSIFYITNSPFAAKNLYCLEHLGIFYCSDSYRVRRDYRRNFLVMFINSGRMVARYRGQEHAATAGDVVLLDCREPHEYFAEGLLSFYFFHFEGGASEAYFNLIYERCGCLLAPPNGKDLESTFKALLHQVRSPALNEHAISVLVHRTLSELAAASQPGVRHTDDTVLEIARYIDENHARNLTLANIASDLEISESHLAHLFKKHTGNTPHQYLLGVRISHARHMLITTNRSLEEIAAQCGFQCSTHFIRTFKKHTGLTPHKFRHVPH